MGDCQNYGPFLGPYYNTGPNTGPNLRDPKRDLILTIPHIGVIMVYVGDLIFRSPGVWAQIIIARALTVYSLGIRV